MPLFLTSKGQASRAGLAFVRLSFYQSGKGNRLGAPPWIGPHRKERYGDAARFECAPRKTG